MRRLFIAVTGLMLVPAAAFAQYGDPYPSSNSSYVNQQGSGNYVEIHQKSDKDAEAAILQQDVSDDNGNRAIVVQQGVNNMADYTQAGRLNNVLNSGSVTSTAPATSAPAPVEAGGLTISRRP